MTAANPEMGYGPYKIVTTEKRPRTIRRAAPNWEYKVTIDGDRVFEWDGFGDEHEALREAISRIASLPAPWKEPHYAGPDVSLWWGPQKALRDAESVTEVRGQCVSEYRALAGHEGFGPDEWLKTTTCIDALPWLYAESARVIAAIGSEQLARDGGEETRMTTREVMDQWFNLVRDDPEANVGRLKRRLLR